MLSRLRQATDKARGRAATSRAARRLAWAFACGTRLASSPALAQHAEQNAATQPDDAFGRAIGTERSGLYTGSEVRGFNPSEAGNIRLNGLYFDLVNLVSARLIEGLTVRFGFTYSRPRRAVVSVIADF